MSIMEGARTKVSARNRGKFGRNKGGACVHVAVRPAHTHTQVSPVYAAELACLNESIATSSEINVGSAEFCREAGETYSSRSEVESFTAWIGGATLEVQAVPTR